MTVALIVLNLIATGIAVEADVSDCPELAPARISFKFFINLLRMAATPKFP